MTDRVLPHNLEAEQAVLGAVFIKPLAWPAMAAELTTGDFFLPAHREVFDAMAAVDLRRQPLDVISVADELKTRGMLGRLEGGESYLLTMANSVPTAENAVHYARIVREKATLRSLIATCAEVSSSACGDHGDHDEFLLEALGSVSKVAAGKQTNTSESLSETCAKTFDDLERAQKGELVTRVPTGIYKLDRLLGGGLALEHLCVPVGLTSMGKSSFGVQVAFRGARDRQIPALIFSLEMSRREMFVKGASSLAKVNTTTFNAPVPPLVVDWPTVMRAGKMAAELTDLVRIEEHRSIGQIIAVSTAWRARNPGPAIILVDHLQKVAGVRTKNSNRQEEVWGVAIALKNLAKDLRLPVIAPAQLNDEASKEKRPPRLGDARDSRGIEHEADVVIGIHRDRSLEAGTVELGVLKHRGGRVGKVVVDWVGSHQGFENGDVSPDHEDER